MNTTEGKRVDVAAVMAQIKREIKEKGLYDELPAFDQVSGHGAGASSNRDTTGLRRMIEITAANSEVQSVYPVEGNALKRLLKKVFQKATRSAVQPMAMKVTQTNAGILQCLEYAANVIEQQQAQIAEMSDRLEELEEALERGAEKR